MHAPEDSRISRLDAIEAAAYRDMFAAAPVTLRQTLGLATQEIGGATLLLAPGLPTPMFNRVIALGNSQPVTDTELDAITEAYRHAGVQNWWIHASPGVHHEALVRLLSARGFSPPSRRAWVKVQRGTEIPVAVETPLEVRRLKPGEEQGLAEATCASFEMPGSLAPWFEALAGQPNWRAVVAIQDHRVLGGGFLHLQGTDAWFGAGSVRPEARRQHAHRALMTERIRLAIEAGCTLLTTETGEPVHDESNPSLRNMIACGFEKIAARLNFAAPLT